MLIILFKKERKLSLAKIKVAKGRINITKNRYVPRENNEIRKMNIKIVQDLTMWF